MRRKERARDEFERHQRKKDTPAKATLRNRRRPHLRGIKKKEALSPSGRKGSEKRETAGETELYKQRDDCHKKAPSRREEKKISLLRKEHVICRRNIREKRGENLCGGEEPRF